MPADHGSRCNQNERLFPPEPLLPQHNPEQLMQGGQSTTRTFGVQSQQLLTESEIFQDEVLPGTKRTDNPSQKMSERGDDDRNHGQNLIEKRRIQLACKSFIPRVHEVLTRDNTKRLKMMCCKIGRDGGKIVLPCRLRFPRSDKSFFQGRFGAASIFVQAIRWTPI